MGEKNAVRVIRYRRLSHDGKASFLYFMGRFIDLSGGDCCIFSAVYT